MHPSATNRDTSVASCCDTVPLTTLINNEIISKKHLQYGQARSSFLTRVDIFFSNDSLQLTHRLQHIFDAELFPVDVASTSARKSTFRMAIASHRFPSWTRRWSRLIRLGFLLHLRYPCVRFVSVCRCGFRRTSLSRDASSVRFVPSQ